MSKILLKIISFAGLLLTLIPSFLVFSGRMDLNSNKLLMLIGTLLWFIFSPFWINKSKQTE